MQSLPLALSSPLLSLSQYQHSSHTVSSAYDHFVQAPYRAADPSNHLQNNGSNFAELVAGLNRVLCIALNCKLSIKYCPSLLENCTPQENREISHFIVAMLPPISLCALELSQIVQWQRSSLMPSRQDSCPANHFQKLKVVCKLLDMLVKNGTGQPKPNSVIILTLRRTFAIFKKLGVKACELEVLLVHTACHTPPNLDQVAFNQLVKAAILTKGKEKPSLTFVVQVILNTFQKNSVSTHCSLPFIYCVSDPPPLPSFFQTCGVDE
ncbi:hypothetical protein O181_030344 [Austropuccinia psidii MF-1]|uniref:Uncharacterized protein n=1 Tax=Austropuccinia psidii MF-1 TaxID=1389203 RepID=A0A9Q3H5H2_9BASI|nr:hypothetical protein [Austropuccinia psidii MF-1]